MKGRPPLSPGYESDGHSRTRHRAMAGSLPNANLFKWLKMRKMSDPPGPAFQDSCVESALALQNLPYVQVMHSQFTTKNRIHALSPQCFQARGTPPAENAFGLHSSFIIPQRKFLIRSRSLAHNPQDFSMCSCSATPGIRSGRPDPSPEARSTLTTGSARLRGLLGPTVLR